MRKIQQILATVVLIITSARLSSAEMPKELEGHWILNAEATEKFLTTSPRWKPEDAKFLPMILKRMSKVSYEFKNNIIMICAGDKKNPMPVTLKQSDKGKYIFEGKMGSNVLALTISINSDGNLNIRSSATNDMDYYLYKRGKPDSLKPADDKKLALEIMKESLDCSSHKPKANSGK